MKLFQSKKISADQLHVVHLAQELISKQSVTPVDGGCQEFLAARLELLDFSCYHFCDNNVYNMIATYDSKLKGPTVAFSGHTDVVPPGDSEKWKYSPFSGHVSGGMLYGRGVADMKGGIAATIASLERYFSSGNIIKGKILFLLTSDEEGEAEFGSKSIAKYLDENSIILDYCIIAEPTANNRSGDVIKIGRRGSISGLINVSGKSGHVAYPQYASNAITSAITVCHKLLLLPFEKGCSDFPGTNLEISGIRSSSFTDNVIPDGCEISFNIRFDHKYSIDVLKSEVHNFLQKYNIHVSVLWERPCQPYFTEKKEGGKYDLEEFVSKAIYKTTGSFPIISMSGGTSDGRFFSNKRTQVIEIGLPNSTIHQIDERVEIKELVRLEQIFYTLLEEIYLT